MAEISSFSSASIAAEKASDMFDGVFIPVVEGGEVKYTKNAAINPGPSWYDGKPEGTKGWGVQGKTDTGVDDLSVAVGQGRYGGDCLRIVPKRFPFTVDVASNRIIAPGHPHKNGDGVKLWTTGTLPNASPVPLKSQKLDGSDAAVSYQVTDATADNYRLLYGANSGGSGLVTLLDEGTGEHYQQNLAGWWVWPMETIGGQGVNMRSQHTPRNYLGPPEDRPFNIVECWLKFPKGYRKTWAAGGSKRTMTWGTYNFDERWAPPAGKSNQDETYGYHFYYWVSIRHDKSDGGWVRFIIMDQPVSMRSRNFTPRVANPTAICSPPLTVDSLTRIYWNEYQYRSDSEIPQEEHEILFDRLRIYYQKPKYDMEMEWDTFVQPVPVTQPKPAPDRLIDQTYEYDFTLTNNEDFDITGRFHRQWTLSEFIILDESRNEIISVNDNNPTDVTVPANGTWKGTMQVPVTREGWDRTHGITFFPLSEITTGEAGRLNFSPSFTDPYVETNTQDGLMTPFDGFHVSITQSWENVGQAPQPQVSANGSANVSVKSRTVGTVTTPPAPSAGDGNIPTGDQLFSVIGLRAAQYVIDEGLLTVPRVTSEVTADSSANISAKANGTGTTSTPLPPTTQQPSGDQLVSVPEIAGQFPIGDSLLSVVVAQPTETIRVDQVVPPFSQAAVVAARNTIVAQQLTPPFGQSAILSADLIVIAAQITPPFSQAATLAAKNAIVTAQVTPPFSQAAVVAAQNAVVAAQVTPPFSHAATLSAENAVVAMQVTPAFGQSAILAAQNAIVAAQSTPAFSQSALIIDVVEEAETVVAAQIVPAFSQSAIVAAKNAIISAQVTPPFSQAATVAAENAITAAQVTPRFSQAAVIVSQPAIVAAQSTPPFGQSALLGIGNSVVAAQTIPPFSQSATVAKKVAITATQVVPPFGQSVFVYRVAGPEVMTVAQKTPPFGQSLLVWTDGRCSYPRCMPAYSWDRCMKVWR